MTYQSLPNSNNLIFLYFTDLAAGGSIDWVYDSAHIRYPYALELRDQGQHGFMLPVEQILPTAEETWTGIKAAVKSL